MIDIKIVFKNVSLFCSSDCPLYMVSKTLLFSLCDTTDITDSLYLGKFRPNQRSARLR